jgi:C4-dicarboxylate transporter, DctQ subunit
VARWIGYIGFVSDKLNIAGGALSGISILVAALIVTYEVIVRYIFQSPTTWVLEISIYLCLASVFLAGGYALREHAHIDVDVVVRKLPIEDQKLIRIIGFLLVLVYCLVFTWKGLELTVTSIVHKEVSPTLLNTPMVIPHSLIPIGGIMLVLELIRQILNDILNFHDRDRASRLRKRGGRYISSILFAVLVGGSFCLFSSQALTPWGLTILVFVLIFGGPPHRLCLRSDGPHGFLFDFRRRGDAEPGAHGDIQNAG